MKKIELNLKEVFENLNFTDEDLKIYLFLINNGGNSVQTIANKTGIARSTCYNILDRLTWKGFLSFSKDGETVIYKAEDPEVIKKLLASKVININNALKSLDNIFPDLEELFSRIRKLNTDTRYYYGRDNMKKILFKMLEESKSTEVLSTCHGEVIKDKDLSDNPEYLMEYFQKEKEIGITERGILEDTQSNREYVKDFCSKTSTYKFSPRLEDISTTHIDKYIFNTKVLILNFESDYAVYIDDPFIAQNERVLFEIMWKAIK